MNIQISWDNEDHTVIRYDYSPAWTWEEFRKVSETVLGMMDKAGGTVHIIANFADGAFPPMGAMGRFKAGQETLPEETVIMIVGGGTFINALVSTYTKVYRALGKKLIVAKSLQDARAKIADLQARSQPKS